MKNTILIFTLLLVIFYKSIAQNFEWINKMGGTGTDKGTFIATDLSGNVYTTGSFEGTAEFGSETFTSEGESDIFISKADENGNLLWAKSIGSMGSDEGYSIFLDKVENYIYLTGVFEDNVDFDPSQNTSILNSNGYRDVFILKLTTSGELVWAKNVGSGGNDYGLDLTADNSGNVFITGYFGNQSDFDPGAGIESLTAQSFDIFILKLDVNGDFVWAKKVGGGSEDLGESIVIDNNGDVYISGVYSSWVSDFDPGQNEYSLDKPEGFAATFILKLTTDGDFIWAKKAGGADYYSKQSLQLDKNNNIYIVGSFDEQDDFDPSNSVYEMTPNGGKDIFLTKLTTDGDFIWAKQFGGTEDDHSYSLDIDDDGHLFLSGDFKGIADFDPSINQFNLTSSGGTDAFLTKLDNNGDFIWAKQFSSTNSVYANYISLDQSDNIYLTGSFKGTSEFNIGSVNNSLISSGESDVFLLKLNQDILTGNLNSVIEINKIVKVYPNPTKGDILIEVEKEFSASDVVLRNITGQIIQSYNLNGSTLSEFYIDGEAGVYFLEISNEDSKSVYRVIKE